jgi:hypothetical protein
MATFRSSRLESVLGGRWDQATYAQIAVLVRLRTPEGPDLDFKRDSYWVVGKEPKEYKEKQRRELTKDVAALANSGGGVLVIGVDEDKQARARSVSDVSLSDQHKRWIESTVASDMFPRPIIEGGVKGS